MSGAVRGAVAQQVVAPAGHHAHADVEQPREQSMLESLMEIAHALELLRRPRALEAALVTRQTLLGEVPRQQAFEYRLGRQHAGLDRKMNPLEPRAVQEAARVAAQQQAVRG